MTPDEDIIYAAPLVKGQVLHDHARRVRTVAKSNSLRQKSILLLEKLPGLDGMPSGLNTHHHNLGHLYKPLDALVSEHTEENAFRCGISPARYDVLRARLVGRPVGPVRPSFLPVLLTVNERLYRQCPECCDEHIATRGFAHIELHNGLPFVSMCPIHGIELRSTAEQALLFDQVCRDAANAYQRLREFEYSVLMRQCLQMPAEQSPFNRCAIVEALTLGRWIGGNGRLNLAEFLHAFIGVYNGSFSDVRLDILCTSPKYVENALRSLLREDRALHPVWCVLFRWFADSCACSVRTARPKAREPEAVEPSEQQIRTALSEHSSLTSTAAALGVSASYLNCMCRRFGVARVWRPKKLDPAILQSIHRAFDEGVHPKDVMRRFKVSQSTAYRILASREDRVLPIQRRTQQRTEAAKAAWLEAVSCHPSASEKSLRQKYNAIWMHLYRHARTWLNEIETAKTARRRHSIKSRDSLLVARVSDALRSAHGRYTAPGTKPVFKSAYRLRIAIGMNEHAFESTATGNVARNVVESPSEFVARRIRWAYSSGQIPPYKLSTIARALSLKPSTIQKIFLRKTQKERETQLGNGI
jgi:hypothetical protein